MNSNRPKRENTQSSASSPSSAEVYEILVQGELDSLWDAWFEGMSLLKVINGESGVVCTLISGEVADQAALHGVFMKIRSLGLNLISVNRIGTTEASYPGARNGRFQTKGDMKNE